ncbi:predicted protein [Nematostella vectensis]|uniref:Uncharacterized protein n=1 Tax=Nematostella vectensis TaxID=45351 RepID=A7SSM5_NEMVE|nr:predicted protein [Nematostella vectensis]|eukprot:XP_001625375.1 predicted protein [Nematostella vectensis]
MFLSFVKVIKQSRSTIPSTFLYDRPGFQFRVFPLSMDLAVLSAESTISVTSQSGQIPVDHKHSHNQDQEAFCQEVVREQLTPTLFSRVVMCIVIVGLVAGEVVRERLTPTLFSRVVMCIVIAGLVAGQISSLSPDYQKARTAAGKIFKLLDRTPAIDSASENGLQPNCL